jgi:hypothetical protein
MKHMRTFVVLLAVATAAVADEKPTTNARAVVEGYVAAALAGKVKDAGALAVGGRSPAKKERIEEFKVLLGRKSLEIARVLVGEKKGQAIALSEAVKLTKANPDGRDTGYLVFALVKSKDQWLLADIDFRTEQAAREKFEEFQKKNPDAKEIPARSGK